MHMRNYDFIVHLWHTMLCRDTAKVLCQQFLTATSNCPLLFWRHKMKEQREALTSNKRGKGKTRAERVMKKKIKKEKRRRLFSLVVKYLFWVQVAPVRFREEPYIFDVIFIFLCLCLKTSA